VDPGRLARLRAATQLLHRPTSVRDPAELALAIEVEVEDTSRFEGMPAKLALA
jgi:hypothetical protein